MTNFESLQSRRLFAAGPVFDTHFGDAGHVALPSYLSVNGMLATHGSIYVDAYNYKKDRRLVYKYSDAGVMDTAWGHGGYVVPGVVDAPKPDEFTPLTLAYDARTRGLLLGYASNTTIDVQRLDAAGSPDLGWGDQSIVEYHKRGTILTLGVVQPLAGKKMMLAFQSAQQLGKTANGTATPGGNVDLDLLRLDRHGRYDATFAGDGLLTVFRGHYTAQTATTPRDSDEPTFGDLQLRDDGGYRLIDTRERTVATYDIDGGFDTSSDDSKTGRTVQLADSTVVSADGVVQSGLSQAYTLNRWKYVDVGLHNYNYRPKLAVAEGADGVAVLAGVANDTGTSILHLTPTSRSQSTPLPLSDPNIFGLYRNAIGDTFVETTGVGLPKVVRLNAGLSLNRHFAASGTYTENDGYAVHAADDDGRLVVYSSRGELLRLV